VEAAVTTLWDTTGTELVKALSAERRTYGGVTSGLALTLVVVVDKEHVEEAERAATVAASQHQCRLLIVVRRALDTDNRLDAEVSVGGRLGPAEAVVMRMYGRLTLHAESVVLPLLAPDVPVVTWWHGEPPAEIATDPLGVFADRRVTDCARAHDQGAALRRRAEDYVVGDTDLCWTRTTPWRALLAGAFDTLTASATEVAVTAEERDPAGALLAGWLGDRLDLTVSRQAGRQRGISAVEVRFDDGGELSLRRDDGRTAVLRRTGVEDRLLPLPERDLGDELAEELRRLDPDDLYGEALGAATGLSGLSGRHAPRIHLWRDPEVAAARGAS
jgi:glucose-6-phosphate dehydrogenase assembly protein OpcA